MTGGFIAIGALAVLLIAPPRPDAADVGPRVAAAQAAAQKLQGPLDGSWLLRDAAGRPLYRFEIVDPAGGRGPLTGAWGDARGRREVNAGFIELLSRRAQGLRIRFRAGEEPVISLRLIERSPGAWTGRLNEGGVERAVAMRRN
ncbi:MAG: hypothetical protein M3T55_01635 [Pseudomonadota bacterium]|nr:hypothetical protein [Pseudomonadota bacterium]